MVTASCGSGPDASEPVTGAKKRRETMLVRRSRHLLALPHPAWDRSTEPTFTGPGSLHGRPPAAERPQVLHKLQRKTPGKPSRKYRLPRPAPPPGPRASPSAEGSRPPELRRPSGLAGHKHCRDYLIIQPAGWEHYLVSVSIFYFLLLSFFLYFCIFVDFIQ